MSELLWPLACTCIAGLGWDCWRRYLETVPKPGSPDEDFHRRLQELENMMSQLAMVGGFRR